MQGFPVGDWLFRYPQRDLQLPDSNVHPQERVLMMEIQTYQK